MFYCPTVENVMIFKAGVFYFKMDKSILCLVPAPAARKHFLGDIWVNFSGKRSALVPIITLLCLLPFSHTCTLYFKQGKKQISRSIYWCINIIIYYIDTSVLLENIPRVVTKISSCQVNTTSRRGIKQQGISFSSIFLLFSNKSSRGPHS